MEGVIKVDIDYKPSNLRDFARDFTNRLKMCSKFLNLIVENVEVYETEKGFHIYVYLSENGLNNYEVIIVQLVLGSDYKRELFNLKRVRSDSKYKNWNVLFKTKGGKLNERATRKAIILTKLINAMLSEE